MEQQHRSPHEDGDSMKLRKQKASSAVGAQAARATIRLGRIPEVSVPRAEGGLDDLSVDAEVAAVLRRRRWRAVIQVALPMAFHPDAELPLVDLVDRHLEGRNPLTGSHGRTLVTSFSVMSAGDKDRAAVERFAYGLARAAAGDSTDEARVVTSGITFTDMSDIEQRLPENLREEAYAAGA
ncbi:hypothetical protein [Pseudolysinimonas sp.]|jgi:hypothetical protein|uniref:hypothetical protein n=1 Tax=Pseudolysinimonas sp. TaxID=2680009 RepID=UPI003782E819